MKRTLVKLCRDQYTTVSLHVALELSFSIECTLFLLSKKEANNLHTGFYCVNWVTRQPVGQLRNQADYFDMFTFNAITIKYLSAICLFRIVILLTPLSSLPLCVGYVSCCSNKQHVSKTVTTNLSSLLLTYLDFHNLWNTCFSFATVVNVCPRLLWVKQGVQHPAPFFF